ncbi:hypothetical protein CAPTEDRAFT_228043 [Capitella teleta]|uniref:Phosphatidic acid phosphatase type 2/haloperoxidase domain-containing protein n=1 Tax=Capitella teleta TaxID=283909 RepID=R7TNZ9_CAPTE|nr:hypothetical protein CAPTEDRAFT_228043 [Capitella teleta]|eukprot:ELT92775.1 hypothetical protein CAPTEDRAFT_228043 [Capitella teleta]
MCMWIRVRHNYDFPYKEFFLPWIILKNGVEPTQRGFYCDDVSIKYPYKSSTITNTVLTSISCLLPSLTFVITELTCWLLRDEKKSEYSTDQPPITIASFSVPRFITKLYKLFCVYFFGFLLQQTITNIGKFTIGRLRPHYLDICQPNYSRFSCVDANNLAVYVTETDLCTGEDTYRIEQARLSFPSGHSSMSTYAALYTIFYLQYRLTHRDMRLVRCLLQSVLAYMAIYTCLSRVSDNKHHWSDVLAGAIIGVSIASLMACCVSNFFKREVSQGKCSNSSSVPQADYPANLRPDLEVGELRTSNSSLADSTKRYSRSEYM